MRRAEATASALLFIITHTAFTMQYQFVCKKYKLLDCGRDNGYNKVKTEKGLTIIMIKIVAKFNVQSNKKDTFLKYAAELINSSRKEEGCISYILHQDMNHLNNYAFIEVWEDQEAIALHNQSDHFRDFCAKINQCQAGPADIDLYREVDC